MESLDFSAKAYQRSFSHPGAEPLACALGWKQGLRKVLDLTAGLGKDAVFLARMGFEVGALEKKTRLFALLQSALNRADRGLKEEESAEETAEEEETEEKPAATAEAEEKSAEATAATAKTEEEEEAAEAQKPRSRWTQRLSFFHQDSLELLNFPLPFSPEALYIDPMFPVDTEKAALPKKEMQWLRSLLKEENPSQEGVQKENQKLFQVGFQLCREKGIQRMVIKRSFRQRPWKKPLHTYHKKGKKVCYDLFVPVPRPELPVNR